MDGQGDGSKRDNGLNLKGYISSDYVGAANVLRGKKARRRIVAYVESYDDVLFWRMVLSEFEDETRYFEVMLPSKGNLKKGKRQALLSLMTQNDEQQPQSAGLGDNMIACVDADYDYLLQGGTTLSRFILNNPYVVHTYVYAIENYQCYAQGLHNVCVMSTLNDHAVFDFVDFLSQYSRIVFPLFVWSVMLYRDGEYSKFTITDFNNVVGIKHGRMQDIPETLTKLRHKVHVKLSMLQRDIPGKKEEYLKTKDSLLQLGVTQETTYLYVQGHHLFNNVVVPTMQTVCDELRREREREIRRKACHVVQMQNELSAYTHSQSDVPLMLKKSQGYTRSAPYRRMIADIERIVTK
ncbi:MAG: DUF4435 domain-containing protein [Prevotella sp.]|nr:DUF4435 domain-containing protein [Prevotella sp.]